MLTKPFISLPLYEGEDTSAGGSNTGTVELTPDDILAKLNESPDSDDTSIPDNKESETTPGKTKETETETEENKEKTDEEKALEEELASLEEELETPTDEKLELKAPVSRRALVKDFPDIFKKHPGLESTIYRERAYTEILPTINDAKEAVQALNVLNSFEIDLKKGETVNIMKALQTDDPKGFAKLADNYMDNLEQVDRNAYLHVLGNIAKDFTETMIKYGKETENKDVLEAASTFYQFMFNTTKWEGKKALAVDEVIDDSVKSERDKLSKERADFDNARDKEHTDKLMSSVDNQVKGTIEKTIDPKDEMSDFVKSTAIDKVLSKASELLKSDSRFQNIIKGLKDRAKKEKYSDESLNRIRSAYYTKYKSVLIPIIQSVRKEALKGTNKREKKDEEINDTTQRANRDSAVRNSNSGKSNDSKNKLQPGQDYAGFLNRRG